MAVLETVRVAAVQATPVILDAEACIDKAARLMHEAAGDGAQLAVLPETFVPLPEGKDVFGRGGAAIVEPEAGEVIAGPVYDRKGIVIADCDLRRALHAKRWFDAVGHYSRAESLAQPGAVSSGPAGTDGDETRMPA